MDKISLNYAINNGVIYKINNEEDKSFDQLYNFSINGLIRFLSIKKKKLEFTEETKDLSEEYFENTIIELGIEYKNLNKFDNSIDIFIHNDCFIVDSDGYHFDIFMEEPENNIDYFIPKVWSKRKLLFLVPNEETEYYFQVKHAKYEEME